MFTTSIHSWYKLEYYFLRAQVVVFPSFLAAVWWYNLATPPYRLTDTGLWIEISILRVTRV